MTISTRRVRAGDGPLLRRIRLAALADAPSAFASTYEAEARQSANQWDRLAEERSAGPHHCTFFAFDGDMVVGLVGGHRTDADNVQLVSMWTDPVARGRGIGAALVAAVLDWAAGSTVELWVTRGNDSAQRLYERCGFTETGDFKALPSDPCKDELRMRRPAR
ncbi:MAG: GNAT family N-acetyltransferase [Acidimicrobiales bacterium]